VFTVENRADPTVIRLGFAGAGNMAAALARGWAGAEDEKSLSGNFRIEAMTFADAGSGRAQELAREVGGEAVEGLAELRERSDVVVLAFKPKALADAAAELGGGGPSMISVLAGVTTESLRDAFPDTIVLRAMPNVAVEVRRGVVCYVPGGEGDAERALTSLLGHLGTLVRIDEEAMDAAAAVMSCSPAYIALVAEALARAGADAGLSASLAHELVVDTLAGTAEHLRRRDPEAIRRAVASPGGATEAGLEALAERDLEAAVHEAVRASLERMRR
jgi:pyrroline-5-carboxylate reductase